MSIEVANIQLSKVHRVVTHEKADFISHRIPGLDGDVVQDMGRFSVRLRIDGIFYGTTAKDDLEALRDVYKAREPVDFLAEIVGQAYFAQVIIEQLDVRQAAQEPEQFTYQLTISEYVPPPQPAAGLSLPDIDADLSLDALDFMDMIQLPDLLSAPGFGDPTPPLKGILDELGKTMGNADAPAQQLSDLFGGSSSSSSVRSRDLSASSGGGIFGELGNVDDGGIFSAIEAQLTRLTSAGDSATDSHQQSSGPLQLLERAVSQVLPPNIDRTNVITRGFDQIKGVLPQNGDDLLRGVSGGIDDLFENLGTDLVERLGSIFDRFAILGNLGLGTGTAANTPSASVAINERSLVAVRSLDPVLDNVNAFLDVLPNPLNAKTLLEALSQILNDVPRERVPLQNIPIFDELRDKLATTTGWLQKDATALSTELAGSSTKLATYIHETFYDHKLIPLKESLQNALNASEFARFQTNLQAIPTEFTALAALVNNGNLSTADAAIAQLSGRISAVRATNSVILQNWLSADGQGRTQAFKRLDESLEEGMAEILFLATPPKDLVVIGLATAPLSNLLDEAGVSAFVGGLHELFGAVENFIATLNIAAIADTVADVIQEADAAIETLQNLLVDVTIEITRLLNRVEQFITDLNIAGLIADLRKILSDFEAATVQGLSTIFKPVRDLLLTAFQTINGFVAAINLEEIIGEVVKILQVLTNILSNPTLLNIIETVKTALGAVNTELGNFSFRPTTSTVIDGIGVVKSAFDIIGHIPMPDSIREEVNKALNLIPKSITPVTHAITEGLTVIIDEGGKPVLVAIKDKPTELVHIVEQYSPDKYLTDALFAPYNEFVDKLEELKPTVLMQPVNAELTKLKDKIKQEIDPVAIFRPLQAPFNSLIQAIDSLNPMALIQPLQDKLTEGVHAITSRLPIDAADAVLEQVNQVATEIQNAVDSATSFRNAMEAVNTRFSGLQNADTQVRQLGDEVAAKLDALTDYTPIVTALTALEHEIDGLTAAALQGFITPVLDDAITQIQNLDPQNRLVALVRAKQTFPRTALNALPDSDQKTALVALLDDFVPMNTTFTNPISSLQDVLTDLKAAKTKLTAFFPLWQTRYHAANGALSRYRKKNMPLAELKTMLKTTVREQLTDTLIPIFVLVKRFQALLAALLTEITDLIQQLETQIEGLLHINTALQEIQSSIHSLVDQLNGLDITFIATEIKDIFEAVETQLNALNPQEIGQALKTTFDGILNAIDPNTLLGLVALDAEHKKLIDIIHKNDPQKLLTNAVQPEYDKVLGFLKKFEIADIINTFLEVIERLRTELTTELDRTATAYEDMIHAIPSDFQGEIGVSATIGNG